MDEEEGLDPVCFLIQHHESIEHSLYKASLVYRSNESNSKKERRPEEPKSRNGELDAETGLQNST